MNRPFGLGVTAGETGIIQAAPAVPGTGLNIAPVIMANHHVSQAYLAATAAGDRYAGVALASTLMHLVDGNVSPEEALAKPRYAPGVGAADVLIEQSRSQKIRDDLVRKGLQTFTRKSIGQVNLMYCDRGIVIRPANCVVRTDPRTAAYGVNSEL
jgi:gamma-glutamyltranspeptidase